MSEFLRRQTNLLEWDIDRCRLLFGAGACTAGTDVRTGTSQAGATDTTIKLDAGASAVDDTYNGDAVTEANGRRAIITDYDGTTKVATVDRPWPVNLLAYAAQVDQWTLSGITVSADALADPWGQTKADRLEEDGSTGVHQAARSPGALALNDVLYIQVRVRGDEVTELQIDLTDAVFGASAFANYDLAAGTATDGGAGEARIYRDCDGWWILEFRATVATAGTPSIFFNLGRSGSFSYAGTTGEGLYLTGAQASVNRYSDYMETGASAIGLPDGVAFRIITAGSECYNTFQTCQDKANFARGRKCWKFCNPGAPVPRTDQVRPYLVAMSKAPTEIDVFKGIARRGKVTVSLEDEPGTDYEADPYYATRASAATGTFFSRLVARNRNTAGRFARLRTAYLTGDWLESQFTDELYVIESVDGPDSRGLVKVTLKDPIKLSDRAKLPAPSAVELHSDILAADLTIRLAAGHGLDLPYWTGTVRIGDEILEYTNRQVADGWTFKDSDDTFAGWTGAELSAAVPSEYYLTVTADGTGDHYIRSPGDLSINGQQVRYVSARIRRVSGSGWDGILAYSTSLHGIGASYYKQVADTTVTGQWVVVTWDMHDLTVGGTDWQNSLITQLHIELWANNTTDTFDIDWIAYGAPAPVSSDVLVLADSTYRGKWGTTADDAGAGDTVQLCTVYQDAPAWSVLEDLLLKSGIPAVNVGSAEMEAEDDEWLGEGYLITAVLSEPVSATKLIEELAVELGGFIWWDPVQQLVRFNMLAPLSLNETIAATLTDEGDVQAGSVRVTVREDLRRTEFQYWYGRISQTADLSELVNFARGRLHIDADAESDNEYGDVRNEVVRSRWYTAQNDAAVATAAYRRLAFYRNAPKNIELQVDPKNGSIGVGDYVDIFIENVADETGAAVTTRCLVIRRRDDRGRVTLQLLPVVFGIRVAFIAPDSAGDYPADSQYVHIVPDTEFFADGTPGYQPF